MVVPKHYKHFLNIIKFYFPFHFISYILHFASLLCESLYSHSSDSLAKSLIIIITKMCVLKYIGDAIIAFFRSGYNKLLACHKAVQCANSMITVIKNGINPTLDQYDYRALC
jgi:hypothetical protein